MSQINTYQCDSCRKKVKAKYNGEHYLPPEGWMTFFDFNAARTVDAHICKECYAKFLKKKVKNEK